MSAAWILYVLLVGTLVAAAARLFEGMLRISGRPVRWIWAGALGLTLALAAIAPQRADSGGVSPELLRYMKVPEGASASAADVTVLARISTVVKIAREALVAPVERTLAAAERAVPTAVVRSLGILSLALTALLLLLFATVHARFHSVRLRWPIVDLLGVRVRVSPQAGPAVVGLSHPEIVVPSWLLRRTADEQRLVLVHEREHVRARDPLLLAGACAVAALVPWHPAVWWMLSRLRLAVELDCDVRVLRQGIAPRSYGTLLIDLAERCSGLRIGAPALAGTSSHLEQRLLAMNNPSSRFARLRAGALGAAALVAVVAACEAKLPTTPEVENMNVARAQEGARKMQLIGNGGDVTYYVDGVKTTFEKANALGPDQIGAIEVRKQDFSDGKPASAEVHITTRKPGDPPSGMKMRTQTQERIAGPGGDAEKMKSEMLVGERQFAGVVIIDGVRATSAAMNALSPNDIVSVEVIKGGNAASLYPAPEAANGVIRITTKKGTAKQ